MDFFREFFNSIIFMLLGHNLEEIVRIYLKNHNMVEILEIFHRSSKIKSYVDPIETE